MLSLTLTAELLAPDGSPMVFAAEGDRVWWVPPSRVDRLDPALREVTEAAGEVRMEVYVRHSETGEMHFLPVTGDVERLPVEGACGCAPPATPASTSAPPPSGGPSTRACGRCTCGCAG